MKKVCLWVVLGVFTLLSFGWVALSASIDTNDWLWQTYDYSHQNPKWWYPYSSDVEADDLFNTNAAINVGTDWVSAGLSDSVLVRAARFLMRVAVMLWIPIIIFWAIKVALSFGDKGKLSQALKQIWYMLWWLILILFSVLLVIFITSITRSSLDLFYQDLW